MARGRQATATAMVMMSDKQPKIPEGRTPFSSAFKQFICEDWAPYSDQLPLPLDSVASSSRHRADIAQQFPGERLVVPAGSYKQRNNDCDYPFRPHSAFTPLPGLGTDREPDAVLLIEPDGEARLYFQMCIRDRGRCVRSSKGVTWARHSSNSARLLRRK